jgi:hypothetical protein
MLAEVPDQIRITAGVRTVGCPRLILLYLPPLGTPEYLSQGFRMIFVESNLNPVFSGLGRPRDYHNKILISYLSLWKALPTERKRRGKSGLSAPSEGLGEPLFKEAVLRTYVVAVSSRDPAPLPSSSLLKYYLLFLLLFSPSPFNYPVCTFRQIWDQALALSSYERSLRGTAAHPKYPVLVSTKYLRTA